MNHLILRSALVATLTTLTSAAMGCASDAEPPSFTRDAALVETGGQIAFSVSNVHDADAISVRSDADVFVEFVPYDPSGTLAGGGKVVVSSDTAGRHLVDLFVRDELVDQLDLEFVPVAAMTWEAGGEGFGPPITTGYVVRTGGPSGLRLVGRATDGRVLDELVPRSATSSSEFVEVAQVLDLSLVFADQPGTYEIEFTAPALPPTTFPLVVIEPSDVVGLDVSTYERDGTTCFVARGRTATFGVLAGIVPTYTLSDVNAVLTGERAERCFTTTPSTGTVVTATWNGHVATHTF